MGVNGGFHPLRHRRRPSRGARFFWYFSCRQEKYTNKCGGKIGFNWTPARGPGRRKAEKPFFDIDIDPDIDPDPDIDLDLDKQIKRCAPWLNRFWTTVIGYLKLQSREGVEGEKNP
ncbi:MAG: hypothetical protein ACOZBW_12910 [Thermodesulfobacteriota bacterium]